MDILSRRCSVVLNQTPIVVRRISCWAKQNKKRALRQSAACIVTNHGFTGECSLALRVAQSLLRELKRLLFGAHRDGLNVSQDGRLSVLRLEQLLREKITTNTTFQVKTATGGIGTGEGGISGPQQLEREVEVTHSPTSRREGME